MTEQDVRGWVYALKGSIQEGDAETAAECAMEMLENFLVTQVRILETLEHIRDFGAGPDASGNRK